MIVLGDLMQFLAKEKDLVMVRQRDIFMAFFRAGLLGYGGGLSAVPLMQR